MKTLTRCARCTVRLMLLAHLLYAPILCLRFCELRAMLAGGDSMAAVARLAVVLLDFLVISRIAPFKRLVS